MVHTASRAGLGRLLFRPRRLRLHDQSFLVVVLVLSLTDLSLSTQFALMIEAIEHSHAESSVPQNLCGRLSIWN